MDKYQVMPPLTDQEYQELKDSIAQYGVQVAVEYDEDGNILDGHHRMRACKELGIANVPRIVKVGMDEQQKLDYALTVNTMRRQLTREQKQELIRQQLKRTPEKSDRQIAGLVGTDHKTVSSQRKELENIGEIPQCDRLTTDGRIYPAQRKDMVGRAEIPHAEKVIDSLGREQPRQTKPVTLYEPDENTVSVAKEFTETATPEFVNAAAEGKIPLKDAAALASFISPADQAEAARRVETGEAGTIMEGLDQAKEERREECPVLEDYQETSRDREETLINNTHKAFYHICEKVHYLDTDYSNTARCLLAAGNERGDLIDEINECIERFQGIKAALTKTNVNFLKVVK